ncbi:hypothetical protein TDB9533_01584 [Thalassocella blandensis]|nr:hypothetical protein TDB9533_01584 [Thalassocella blandensis]
MTPNNFANLATGVALAALIPALCGWLLMWLFKPGPVSENVSLDPVKQRFAVKLAMLLTMGGGGLLGVAFVMYIVAGFWWLGSLFVNYASPAILAILSVVIALLPLSIAAIAGFIAKRLGGNLNEAGVSGCIWRGRDVGPILYQMFMVAWLSMFSIGLGLLGLIAAGIWALLR